MTGGDGTLPELWTVTPDTLRCGIQHQLVSIIIRGQSNEVHLVILYFLLPREDDTANAPLLDASESPVKDSLLDGAAIKWIIWDRSHSGYLITENLISPDQHMDIREFDSFIVVISNLVIFN